MPRYPLDDIAERMFERRWLENFGLALIACACVLGVYLAARG